jgi:hypothetical protein
MDKALYGRYDSDPIIDRDGWECGTAYQAYYLLFCADGTVDCFEEAYLVDRVDDAKYPDAKGLWTVDGESVVVTLNRTNLNEHQVMPTMHDTYGPLEALEEMFDSGTHRMEIVEGGLFWRDRETVFSLKDGATELFSKV